MAACQKAIDNLIAAVEKGALEIEEIAPRLEHQRSEKSRLQRELALADEQVVSVDLHPTALRRFKQNLDQISGAGDQIDPQLAASFRELVESVVVMPRKAGEPYSVETRGRLARLIGAPQGRPQAAEAALFMGDSRASMGKAALSAKPVVPAEGIEPPTFGLQNRCSTAELSRQLPGKRASPERSTLAGSQYQTCPESARTREPVSPSSNRRPEGRLFGFIRTQNAYWQRCWRPSAPLK